jgi:DNA-binding response OmpR family regulator
MSWRKLVANRHVLIVEDEESIRVGVAEALRAAGYEILQASDGISGLATARRPGIRIVLLDLMLPKLDGMSVLKQLRQSHPTLPVIVLTARGAEEERVAGLKAGADDYVVKPFSAKELVARVEAVLRRSAERPMNAAKIRAGKVHVDLERRELRRTDGERDTLSETECAILLHLAAYPGRVISRDELLTRVWGLSGDGIETRTIDMHIARLRAKLATMNDDKVDEPYILTVRGKGYMLGPSVTVTPAGDEPAVKGGSRK